MRLALVFDKIVRPDTTGIHVESALRILGHEASVFAPLVSEGPDLRFRGYDELVRDAGLYLQVDDDLSYPGPVKFHPSVYWCIDCHRFETMVGGWSRARKMQGFDFVFVAQRDGAQRLNVPWLPLGYNPGEHCLPSRPEKRFDWCFVGSMNCEGRRTVTSLLRRRFPSCFVGRAYGEQQRRIFAESKIVLNYSVGNDISMRFFEATASGSFFLTNSIHNGEDELFPGLATFQDCDDLVTKVEYFLLRGEERESKAAALQAYVLAHHSYVKRMEQMLNIVLGRQ